MKHSAKIDKTSKAVLETVFIDDEDVLDKHLHKHYDNGDDVFWKEFETGSGSSSSAFVGDTYCENRSKFLSKDRYNLPSGYVFDEETCDIVCIIDKDPPELTEEQLADGYNVEWSDELMDWEIKKIN